MLVNFSNKDKFIQCLTLSQPIFGGPKYNGPFGDMIGKFNIKMMGSVPMNYC